MKKVLKLFLLCICFGLMLNGLVFATDEGEKKDEMKILAIGNSFSVDAMQYLWDIANDGGVKVVLGNLYIGGCSLDTHAKNIAEEKSAYTYYKNTNGVWSNTASVSVQTALADEEWDIITVQQASNYSGVASSYSKLSYILDYIAENAPDAKVYFHMTWAYQQNSTHSGFANYNNDQMTMYNAIQSTLDSEVKTKNSIVGIIPSGTAIQNLRTSYIGDTVTRDGYHLSYDFGRYTAALTWYAYFTGASVDSIDWVPDDYATEIKPNLAAIREAVTSAIAAPYEVTEVTAAEPDKLTDAEIFESLGYNINAYTEIDWVLALHAYYNSSSSTIPFELISSANSTASNLPNFIASHRYTKETLPVGSVIILDDGYKYRPEGWVDENYVSTSSTRPANITSNATVVTDEWWGEYTFRAFNFAASSARKMTVADAEHLRIYVPKYPDVKLINTADTNGDGTEDLKDCLQTLKTCLNKEGYASDLNNDGIVTLLDVIQILKKVVA